MVKILVEFPNNPEKKFHAGQRMNGTVVLQNKTKTVVKISRLTLKITGKAQCEWTEDDQGRTIMRRYLGTEKYLDMLINQIRSNRDINPGEHPFKFTVQLPSNLPESLTETYGFIKYSILVILQQTRRPDLKYSVDFHVCKQVDLNRDFPELRMTREFVKEKTFGFHHYCVSQPPTLSMKVIIPRTAFTPGQSVKIITKIENPTSKKVRNIKISLVKKVRFISNDPHSYTKVKEMIVKSDVHEDFTRYTSKTYLFEIPSPLQISTNRSCSIMELFYQIYVKCTVSGFQIGPRIKIPIVIGTIPFNEDSPPRYSQALFGDGLPPPSYDSIIQMGVFRMILKKLSSLCNYKWFGIMIIIIVMKIAEYCLCD